MSNKFWMIISLWVVLVLPFGIISEVSASNSSGHGAGAASQTGSHGGQQQAHQAGGGHGGGQDAGLPINYVLSWILTIAGLILGWIAYTNRLRKGVKDHLDAKRSKLANSIVFLMVVTFLVDMFPAHGYHEGFAIGLFRLGMKIACGLLFLYFGLSYHYAHDHHDSHH